MILAWYMCHPTYQPLLAPATYLPISWLRHVGGSTTGYYVIPIGRYTDIGNDCTLSTSDLCVAFLSRFIAELAFSSSLLFVISSVNYLWL